jgi:hypothetical protein
VIGSIPPFVRQQGEAGVSSFFWGKPGRSRCHGEKPVSVRGEAGVSSFFCEERQTGSDHFLGRSRCQFIFLGEAGVRGEAGVSSFFCEGEAGVSSFFCEERQTGSDHFF